MDVATGIRKIVDDRGIKRVHISERTGIPVDTISKILNNKRKLNADEFLIICTALDIDPNMFRN